MWWTLTLNPQVMLAYFTDPPELEGIEIHSIRLHRDCALLELVIELPRFPDKPSRKWPPQANTAQAVLRFSFLREITISGWDANNIGSLSVAAEPQGGVRFRFSSPTSQLEGVADFFEVTDITGYVTSNVRT